MLIGWVAFLGSWGMNILFYKGHPSSVDFSFKEKLYIHILGKKRLLWGYKGPKGEYLSKIINILKMENIDTIK